jgi:hypothetical protein
MVAHSLRAGRWEDFTVGSADRQAMALTVVASTVAATSMAVAASTEAEGFTVVAASTVEGAKLRGCVASTARWTG